MSYQSNKERYELTVRALFIARLKYDYTREEEYAGTRDPLYQTAVKRAVARVHSQLSLVDFVSIYADEFNASEVPLKDDTIHVLCSHIYRLWDSIQTLF